MLSHANISILYRFQTSQGFLITPGNRHYMDIAESDMSHIIKGRKDGLENETGDIIHAAVYDTRPDVGAIVHTHAPNLTAVACLQDVSCVSKNLSSLCGCGPLSSFSYLPRKCVAFAPVSFSCYHSFACGCYIFTSSIILLPMHAPSSATKGCSTFMYLRFLTSIFVV